MRSLKTLLPAAAAILVTCVLAASAQAGIVGSKHDFANAGWMPVKETCLPCHTTHNATVKVNGVEVGAPLWNHQISTATYKMYVEPIVKSPTNTTDTGKVDTNSMLCLSCHDGTVAPDSFGGTAGTHAMSGGVLGTDLSDDHPIGETAIWPAVGTSAFTRMVDPALRKTAGIMPLRKMDDGRDAVGCTTCHEPHNRKSTPHMLWVNNQGSGLTVDGRAVNGSMLCLNCHMK